MNDDNDMFRVTNLKITTYANYKMRKRCARCKSRININKMRPLWMLFECKLVFMCDACLVKTKSEFKAEYS